MSAGRNRMKVRKISMFNQMFLFLALLLLLGNGVLGMLAYGRSQSSLFQQIQGNAINIAQCAAQSVTGEVLQNITAGQEDSQEYQEIVDELAIFRDNAEIEYIYTLRKSKDGIYEFVVDSDTEEPASIGDECEATDALDSAFINKLTTVDEEAFEDEWGMHVSAYSPIFVEEEMIGVIGVDISANWIAEQLTDLQNLIIVSCIGTYVVSLLFLQILIIKFKRSMKKLNEKVEELASGSGDLTKEVDIYSGDELELIAGNMNKFIGQIRLLVKDVSLSTGDILENGKELNSTVNENTHIMRNMNAKIEEISENMEKSSVSSREMSASLSESAKSIVSLAKEVEEMCSNVQNANDNAQKASEMAGKNREKAMNSIQDLQERMRKTCKEAQQIEQVKVIAEEIANISSQTSMLSLNAQIEAARAGSMGAGFAVVATEVGHLSNEIDRAVTQINQINEKVLKAVTALTDVSEEMIQFVAEDVVKDYDAFASIGEEYGTTTATIRNQMMQLGEESFRISTDISEINNQVQEIAETVVSTAENANTLYSSTNHVSANMEQLSASSKNNALHAEKLNEKVNRYTF